MASILLNRKRTLFGLATVGLVAMACVLVWGFYLGGFTPTRSDVIVHPKLGH